MEQACKLKLPVSSVTFICIWDTGNSSLLSYYQYITGVQQQYITITGVYNKLKRRMVPVIKFKERLRFKIETLQQNVILSYTFSVISSFKSNTNSSLSMERPSTGKCHHTFSYYDHISVILLISLGPAIRIPLDRAAHLLYVRIMDYRINDYLDYTLHTTMTISV